MKVLEKIERCVSLIWDFQEIYGEEDIEDFCRNELHTYPQYNEILDYFKRIANLEKENKVLAQNLEDTEILNKAYEKRFDDLEKENAELDCQKNRNKFCYSCANATERCFRNEIGCPCEKYKSYKDENAELKKQLEMSNKVYNDNLDYSHHIEDQLTNAKELLERLLITSCNSDVLNLLPNCSEVLRVRMEAEQFLSEVEDKENV